MKIGNMKQNTKDNNDNPLFQVIMRIDQQRKELNDRKDMISAKIDKIENSKEANTFNADKLLNTPSLSRLKQQRDMLETAMKLPNYADAEFRRLSIPYLEEIAKEMTESASVMTKQIEHEQEAIKLSEEKIEKLRDDLVELNGKWLSALSEIGVTDARVFCFGIYNFQGLVNDYKKMCVKYE